MKRPSLFALVPAALVLASGSLSPRSPPAAVPGSCTRPSASPRPARTGPPQGDRGRLLGPGQRRHSRPGHVLLPDGHRHHQQHDLGHSGRARDRRFPVLLFAGRGSSRDARRPPEIDLLALPEFPHRRHRPVSRDPRPACAGGRDGVLRDVHRDVRRPAVEQGLGGHGHGPHVQPVRPPTARRSARSPSRIPAPCSSSPPISSSSAPSATRVRRRPSPGRCAPTWASPTPT